MTFSVGVSAPAQEKLGFAAAAGDTAAAVSNAANATIARTIP
jgi:hypothetical protein